MSIRCVLVPPIVSSRSILIRAAFVVGLSSVLPALALPSHAGPEHDTLEVIAYCSGPVAEVEKYPLGILTHINYSFLHLRGSSLSADDARASADISHLVSLKKRHPHLKIILSFGGWGGCERCSEVFSTEEGRRMFAESARGILLRFGADGIDLDWEYPAIEGYPGHRYVPEDRHNFTLLVRELRKTLGPGKELSFAAGGFTAYLQGAVEWEQVMQEVDRVNLMTYDFVNAQSTWTGHHTSLHSTLRQRESADNAVRYLDSLGIPRSKIVIGAAFYGRVWENVADTNHGLFQRGTFRTYVNYRDLGTYCEKSGNFRFFWDSVAGAPYAYDARARLFATFDDLRSVTSKTRYAIENGLGGIMFWELRGDAEEHGLLEAIGKACVGGK